MTTSSASPNFSIDQAPQPRPATASTLKLWCPECGKAQLSSPSCSHPICPECGFVLQEMNGILRALSPEREAHFRQFIQEYELVRREEGRGCSSSDYYLHLPYKDVTGHNRWQWEIRGRTFRCLECRVLPAIEAGYTPCWDVLDIGAGNCWLSYRMALRGHRPVAIDLLDNDVDGLGSAKHYFLHLAQPFPRFQAEMDRLPFASGQFDVAIFNASFHYSVDYEQTLREALRCLRRPAYVIIADSPLYACSDSGQAMLQEKRNAFQRRFGFRSDSIPSREYLTWEVVQTLSRTLGLRWNVAKPWYGINWALRPVKARFLRRREPSKFFLLWARVEV